MEERNIEEYLSEICKEHMLTPDEALLHLKAVQEKGVDCDEMKRLEKSNARLWVSLSSQYFNKGLTFWELIDVCTKAQREAAMTYDLDSGIDFRHHAVTYARQALIQAIAEKK